ncbi:hypothetical protein F0562_014326 [Nyssa sinensis]|uniref:Pentacotripeptide-repeat region of PRORP domain-containing protein n=1 Tax=Nyssa sinensis TaxID=561372 RepID=A0A5J4ZNC0_9ASTE|nr:hypothetical protein F0562_014326 [Nyssa sinensis]
MFFVLFSSKRCHLLVRGFHVGKHFSNPSTEDIVFKAICVNLRQRKWKLVDQMSSSLTDSIVSRVIREFRTSPELALEFFKWVGEYKSFSHSLESYCTVIHVLVNSRRYVDALSLMKNLMQTKGYSPLEVLETLVDSYEMCLSSPAVFDSLVRACTQIGATEGAFDVIKKLRMEGFGVSIHAWNNFLNHLLNFGEVGRFWMVYKEMVSLGYFENLHAFNLVIYAFCKECKLLEAISQFYRMSKGGIIANVVTFNMLIDGACKMGDIDLALKILRKMRVMTGDFVTPNSVTYNCLINGYCKLGRLSIAEEVQNEMVKIGIEPNLRTYATLIDGYSRNGSLEEAFRLCDDMVGRGLVPNTVVYNSIIHWLYLERDMAGASLLLSDMIKKHVCPDSFTYSILMKGLCRNGYINEALTYHKWILEKNLIEDDFSHNILINYLCKSKNIAGAKQLLGSMFIRGFIPDLSHIWYSN